MSGFEKILGLRPTHVATRLGADSRLPILNPRDLLTAASSRATALVNVPVCAPVVLPGVLRAARTLDAVVGISLPHPMPDPRGAERWLLALDAAAREAEHEKPLFVQAGPLRLTTAEPAALEQAAEAVYRYLEAGCSLVSLDAGRLAPREAARACRTVAQSALEREIALEVWAPRLAGRTRVSDLRDCLDHLAALEVVPRFVQVGAAWHAPGGPGSGSAPALDEALLRELAGQLERGRTSLCVEDRADAAVREARAWLEAGVRKIDATGAFARAALKALPAEVRSGIEQRAASADLSPAGLFGFVQSLLEGLPEPAKLRLEALAFSDALDTLRAARAQGSASAAIDYLAENAGY